MTESLVGRAGPSRLLLDAGQCAKVADAMITEVKVFGLDTTVGDVRAFFADEHVHLVVVDDGSRVVTTIERSDIPGECDARSLARGLGTLEGRRVDPDEDLGVVRSHMVEMASRRFVVLDRYEHLVGLLCLKRHGRGFCRDEDVQARLAERPSAKPRAPGAPPG
ncbi:CBS domain-containing protein [Aeromicrobium sp.]|uniref:CBS domain-containing protein n=1 Tax=Aeromicrobium sp. TaxID=1871063 RepID=UPI003FA58CAA